MSHWWWKIIAASFPQLEALYWQIEFDLITVNFGFFLDFGCLHLPSHRSALSRNIRSFPGKGTPGFYRLLLSSFLSLFTILIASYSLCQQFFCLPFWSSGLCSGVSMTLNSQHWLIVCSDNHVHRSCCTSEYGDAAVSYAIM